MNAMKTALLLSFGMMVFALSFQSCKKEDKYTTDCNDLDYSGCIECKVAITSDSTETSQICRSDYNSESEFKDDVCANFDLAVAFGIDAKCKNLD